MEESRKNKLIEIIRKIDKRVRIATVAFIILALILAAALYLKYRTLL